jgi:hypothetical protein
VHRTRHIEGHELGSMTVALVLNIGIIVTALAMAIVFTVPDVPVLTLYLVLASTAVIVPIATWPMTHTIWMAIDLRFRPVDIDEAEEAAAWLAYQQKKTPVPSNNA